MRPCKKKKKKANQMKITEKVENYFEYTRDEKKDLIKSMLNLPISVPIMQLSYSIDVSCLLLVLLLSFAKLIYLLTGCDTPHQCVSNSSIFVFNSYSTPSLLLFNVVVVVYFNFFVCLVYHRPSEKSCCLNPERDCSRCFFERSFRPKTTQRKSCFWR